MSLTRREFLELAARQSLGASIAAMAALSACGPTATLKSTLGLDARRTESLIALIDQIIPADASMPAASQAGTLAYFELLAESEPALAHSVQAAVEFYETDARRGFVRGYTLVAERTFGPFSQALGVPWGAEHHRAMRRRFPHLAGLTVIAEDLPDVDNRIELDPAKTDSSGMPAARATYARSENSQRMLEHGAARATELLKAAGAIEIIDWGNDNMAHLMGTARMGIARDRSVVDAWNRAHDVPNLFIVDGSSFTTAAGVNPTSTIGALALRAADGIWRRRRGWT